MRLLAIAILLALPACFARAQTGPANPSSPYDMSDFSGRTPTAAELITALKPAPVLRGLKKPPPKAVSLDTITFEFASDRLTDAAKAALNELGVALNDAELSQFRFELQGHTDAKGSAAYNDKLSVRRAESVKQYLVAKLDVRSRRLHTVGKGERQLKDRERPYSSVNRRVQLINRGATAPR